MLSSLSESPLGGAFGYNTVLILYTAGHNQFTLET